MMCDSHNAVTFCCWVSSSQVPTILRDFNVFIFLQLLDPDDGGTVIVTMWGITVIDSVLYPTVTMMTTVPAAAAITTRTTHCSYVLERYQKQVQHHSVH